MFGFARDPRYRGKVLMKDRRGKPIIAINEILMKRKSSLPLLTAGVFMDFSFDRWDDYVDALSDELMEFGIADDGNINEYGVSIDRLIEFMCIMKAEQQSGRA